MHAAIAIDLLEKAGHADWDEAGIAALGGRLAQLDRAVAERDGDALGNVLISVAVILKSAGERYGRRATDERSAPAVEVSFPQQRVNELIERLREPRPEQTR